MSFLKHHFLEKGEMSSSFDWYLLFTVDCLLVEHFRSALLRRNREPKPAAVLKFHCYFRVTYNFY